MATGENEQALRKVMDFTRLLSVALLMVHLYLACRNVLVTFTTDLPEVDILMHRLMRSPLISSLNLSKAVILLLLFISLLGSRGRKQEDIKPIHAIWLIVAGLALFWCTHLLPLLLRSFSGQLSYTLITVIGYILILAGGSRLSRYLSLQLRSDIFNRENESFPQEERLLDNEYSVNLPARYSFRGRERSSWINIINPFRGLLVLGTPGSGKSYFIIRHVITQHIRKGFSMFVYDFKYDDLTRIAYNTLLKHVHAYAVRPKIYFIHFDDLSRSHRCNPLDPQTMFDITDATESARTIMLGLNREWIKKQGDFFVESPINFLTAVIWFLKKYEDGKYCTLPHVIELMQADYEQLFPVLRTEPEIEVLINPFISAYQNDAMEQLEGQVASAKIGMARLSSPHLYYILSGNDFTLDINDPKAPKIVCMGNNPQKQQVYGAVVSLYVSRMIKLVNRRQQQKCSLVFDEFPTIYFNGIDGLIATARSNKVATTLAMQDYSQLKKDYGREQAEVILNICGNVIAGQVSGDSAKLLADRFGKIVQQRSSISVNSMDTSISRSGQLEQAIPQSRIASLSSGEFVGMVADDPQTPIEQKMFHNHIINDHDAIREEEEGYVELPVLGDVERDDVLRVYHQIRAQVKEIIRKGLETAIRSRV